MTKTQKKKRISFYNVAEKLRKLAEQQGLEVEFSPSENDPVREVTFRGQSKPPLTVNYGLDDTRCAFIQVIGSGQSSRYTSYPSSNFLPARDAVQQALKQHFG